MALRIIGVMMQGINHKELIGPSKPCFTRLVFTISYGLYMIALHSGEGGGAVIATVRPVKLNYIDYIEL